MLILTRRPGEAIWVNDNIRIEVIDEGGPNRQIKIGIEAPKEIHILREELKKRNERRASQRKILSLGENHE